MENQILLLTSGDTFSLVYITVSLASIHGEPCLVISGLEVFIVGTVSCEIPGCDTWGKQVSLSLAVVGAIL